MRRPVWIAGACLSGLFASMCAVTTYSVLSRSLASDVRNGQAASSLPALQRPALDLLGFMVGEMSIDSAMTHAAGLGLTCVDRSMKTIMDQMKTKRAAAADTVSSASARRKTAREAVAVPPQVRMHCTGRVRDRAEAELAAPSSRVLLVFDGPEAPLRHVSLHSTHRDMDKARGDFEAAAGVLTEKLGPASRADGQTIARLDPVVREWHLDRVHARLTALDFGSRVSVTRELFVPGPGI